MHAGTERECSAMKRTHALVSTVIAAALVASAAGVISRTASAQQQGDIGSGAIPYYWETRPATSAAVVNGLQQADLLCGDGMALVTAGGAIMCAITGRDQDEDAEATVAANPAAPARVPTFAETVESILYSPR